MGGGRRPRQRRATPYGKLWRDSYTELARLYDVTVIGVSNVGPITGGPWAGRKCIGCSLAVGPGGEFWPKGRTMRNRWCASRWRRDRRSPAVPGSPRRWKRGAIAGREETGERYSFASTTSAFAAFALMFATAFSASAFALYPALDDATT